MRFDVYFSKKNCRKKHVTVQNFAHSIVYNGSVRRNYKMIEILTITATIAAVSAVCIKADKKTEKKNAKKRYKNIRRVNF